MTKCPKTQLCVCVCAPAHTAPDLPAHARPQPLPDASADAAAYRTAHAAADSAAHESPSKETVGLDIIVVFQVGIV